MKKQTLAVIAAAMFATAAFAHSGVKNEGVMARMATMKSASNAATVLGDMAKGKLAFDPQEAEDARAELIAALSKVPDRFREPHTDPKSEALPAIWDDYDAFLTGNEAAIATVRALNLSDLDALRGSMRALGSACSDCHRSYKE